MKRLFLAILMLGLVTLLVPSLRHRAQPHIDRSREILGEKLEGPLSPVLTPYRRLKTQSQMGKIINELTRRRNMGYEAPGPSELVDFLIARELSPDGRDAWGAPLLLQQRQDSLDIISAGPDIEYHTDDDIVLSLRYRARSPRSGRRTLH